MEYTRDTTICTSKEEEMKEEMKESESILHRLDGNIKGLRSLYHRVNNISTKVLYRPVPEEKTSEDEPNPEDFVQQVNSRLNELEKIGNYISKELDNLEKVF